MVRHLYTQYHTHTYSGLRATEEYCMRRVSNAFFDKKRSQKAASWSRSAQVC